MFAFGIFKVIYAPHKAFREIAQNPKYAGPILIIVLLVATYTVSSYITLSRTFNEQILPSSEHLDIWTENKTLWASNANINETTDALSGGYYGNKSIEFSVYNDTQIWMRLNLTEPANCSGADGFEKVSFRVKLEYPDLTVLNSVFINLFSSQVDYFQYNLTEYFTSVNVANWNNLTVNVGSDSEFVNSTNGANWNSIVGLSLVFTWSENADLKAKIDGLFFRGVFKSPIENASYYLPSLGMLAFMQFVIQWVFLSGLLYIVSKWFGAKLAWKTLFILTGFILVTLLVQALIYTFASATLPTLQYPLEYFGGVEGEKQVATNKVLEGTWIVDQVNLYVQIAVLIWTIILCAVAIRTQTTFSTPKSIGIAALAYFLSIYLAGFVILLLGFLIGL